MRRAHIFTDARVRDQRTKLALPGVSVRIDEPGNEDRVARINDDSIADVA
jgi:hypothetical protein